MGNVACSKLLHLILSLHIIIEPHGRGVLEAILNVCRTLSGLCAFTFVYIILC